MYSHLQPLGLNKTDRHGITRERHLLSKPDNLRSNPGTQTVEEPTDSSTQGVPWLPLVSHGVCVPVPAKACTEEEGEGKEGVGGVWKALDETCDLLTLQTNEEISCMRSCLRVPPSQRQRNGTYKFNSKQNLPDSMDWREKGCVTEVKYQVSGPSPWTWPQAPLLHLTAGRGDPHLSPGYFLTVFIIPIFPTKFSGFCCCLFLFTYFFILACLHSPGSPQTHSITKLSSLHILDLSLV